MSVDISLAKPDSLRSQVENTLRDAIMSGKFLPGTRLIERDLCEQLKISRSSLREALRRLEAEKLVDIVPHRGPVVASMSRHEATELYAIRGLLEAFAAKEFTRLASDAAVAELGEAVAQMHKHARTKGAPGILKAKTRLYDILLGNSGNALMKDILTSLHSRINLLRATSLVHPDRLLESLVEIDQLYAFIKARNGRGAEKAARLHVANAEKAALGVLDSGKKSS